MISSIDPAESSNCESNALKDPIDVLRPTIAFPNREGDSDDIITALVVPFGPRATGHGARAHPNH